MGHSILKKIKRQHKEQQERQEREAKEYQANLMNERTAQNEHLSKVIKEIESIQEQLKSKNIQNDKILSSSQGMINKSLMEMIIAQGTIKTCQAELPNNPAHDKINHLQEQIRNSQSQLNHALEQIKNAYNLVNEEFEKEQVIREMEAQKNISISNILEHVKQTKNELIINSEEGDNTANKPEKTLKLINETYQKIIDLVQNQQNNELENELISATANEMVASSIQSMKIAGIIMLTSIGQNDLIKLIINEFTDEEKELFSIVTKNLLTISPSSNEYTSLINEPDGSIAPGNINNTSGDSTEIPYSDENHNLQLNYNNELPLDTVSLEQSSQ